MKTQNNQTGNKSNQVERVLLKSAAVIVSFVLISFTVSAQGFWKQLLTNNSFGKVAMLMVEELEADAATTSNALPAKAESSAFYIEEAVEEPMEVEAWMTDDVYFGAFVTMAQPEVEKSLEIEEWMSSDKHFSNRFSLETDREMKLEAWMTDDKYWRM
ncbi:hypothetical protein ACRTDU_11305 [Sunxiuqinia elliptica]|uniref:Uncharacterized protein n=1 Tax=Sunxiuqinia elliptica TaxID=655355 RepID=A0A1I2AIQ2_9BACT|nr:hypothetical protein [Sunxiuqinia elliptica]SFE43776.1 hypothetical protein SAMN05216283_101135 [Sunxiuqinia elliptica]